MDGEDDVASEGVGVLAVSQNILGTGVLGVSVGSWVQKAARMRGGRMESEGKRGPAPPKTLLCSAHHLLPGAKSAHQNVSRYIHDPLGRSP